MMATILYLASSKLKSNGETNTWEEFKLYFMPDGYDWGKISIYISLATIIISALFYLVTKVKNFITYKKIGKKLHPYYSFTAIKEAKEYYVKTKGQEKDPSNEIKVYQNNALTIKDDLYDFFVRNVFVSMENDNRYFMILADAGMGKSTFMINLYSRYYNSLKAFFNKSKIKLFPLGEDFQELMSLIKAIQDKENTILLLDALDESAYFNCNSQEEFISKFDELIENVKTFKVILITCRTQFFSNESQEPFELKVKKYGTSTGNSFHNIKKMYVSPFDYDDIKSFLNKKYHVFNWKKKKKAYELINDTNDLLFRPMLLSKIDDLVNNKNNANTKLSIYFELINAWIEREANRYPINSRYVYRINLFRFSLEISKEIYNNYSKNGLLISLRTAERIANEFNIELNLLEIKSRSLLNRNTNGDHKFSHKSIFEFFLAVYAFTKRKEYDGVYNITTDFQNLDFAKLIFEEMQLNYVDYKTSYISEFLCGAISYQKLKRTFSKYEILRQKQIVWMDGENYIFEKWNDAHLSKYFIEIRQILNTSIPACMEEHFKVNEILGFESFHYRLYYTDNGFTIKIYNSNILVSKFYIEVFHKIFIEFCTNEIIELDEKNLTRINLLFKRGDLSKYIHSTNQKDFILEFLFEDFMQYDLKTPIKIKRN